MREVVIISGKGGAGKTSITGAFASLADNPILCDLDVDAPDLHLLLAPETSRTEDFYSGNLAIIDPDRCTGRGLCAAHCRFGAVIDIDGGFRIDPMQCEGCKVCVAFCPAGAIDFPQRHCGQWFESMTRFGSMVHAQLFPGQENSGRLVALLKQRTRELAESDGHGLILCDGAPGIGCPVISSLSGTQLAVVVTEPTLSGLHDLKRVVDLCARFRTTVQVFINKYDLNPEQTEAIETFCADRGIEVICRFPHDHAVTRAMVAEQTIIESDHGKPTRLLEAAWSRVMNQLDQPTNHGELS